MEARAATLLRSRFDSPAQLGKHLHIVNERTLFFFRATPKDVIVGGRIALEISFQSSEQIIVMRGTARSQTMGLQPGLWLEFPDTGRLARRTEDPAGLTNRKQRRIGCDTLVEVRLGAASTLTRMLDVSMGGARLAGSFHRGDATQVQLRVLGAPPDWPSELGRAEMAREDKGDFGVRFLRTDPESRKAVMRLVQLAQEAWARAPEVTHPPVCCDRGVMLEPPVPWSSIA